jgi:ATP-dependent protease HslVU (ClpYQ) peptidase subunit
MTCVVAIADGYGKIIMGGDSFCGDQYHLDMCKEPKVYTVGEVGVGIAGSVRAEHIFTRIINDMVPEKKDITKDWIVCELAETIRVAMKEYGCLKEQEGISGMNDSEYLLAHKGSIYYFENDFGVWESSRPYAAIGSGRSAALGSLSTFDMHSHHGLTEREMCEIALLVAEQQSPWVRGPFKFVTV